MSSENPWHGLPRGQSGHLQARRADPSHPHNFYWACNAEGRYALLLALREEPAEFAGVPEIRGISIQLYRDQKQLQLVLADSADWEMFAVICRDVIEHARSAVTTAEMMDSVLGRLVRWQRLLSRGPRRILEDREIRGLMAELLFLRDELMPRLGSRAVRHWQGPQGKPQDFAVGETLFEIKSTRHGDAARVQISSPDQLWSGGQPLYLNVIALIDVAAQATGALTLPGVIQQISEQLSEPGDLERFEECLTLAGYFPVTEYKERAFSVSQRLWYAVTTGFPIIAQNNIPGGVADLKYSILLSVCEPFRVTSPQWQDVSELRNG